MKMRLKILSAKWRPFCPGGDELTQHNQSSSVCIVLGMYCFSYHNENMWGIKDDHMEKGQLSFFHDITWIPLAKDI